MNLADFLLAAALAAPTTPALIRGERRWSYAELDDLTARFGAELVTRGVTAGSRVAMACENDEGFVVGYLACLHVGAVAVPLNPQAPGAELQRELEVVEPAVVLGSASGVDALRGAGADVVAIDVDGLPDARAERYDAAEGDAAALLFTSGTAGSPKAAVLTHGSLAANVRQVQDHPGLRLEVGDVGLGALPFFHVFGLNVVLGVGLSAGATIVLVDRFEPAAAVRLVREHEVTVLAGVPTMYEAWLALSEADAPSDAFASLRLAVSGAAPLPPHVADDFRARFGIVLHQGYGLTEASPIVTTTVLCEGTPRPGAIGPHLPGMEARLVDEQGDDVLVGDPGELWVRGPNVFPGYWHDAEATARALTPDGWLKTGDVAVIELDGDLRLVDRAKDLIIVSGFNVYPVEVEDVLRSFPAVADAAVVGEPNDRTGEGVTAFVALQPGATATVDDLHAHCAQQMARYKCPSRIEIVDAIPRNPAGKLIRRDLV